MDLGVKVQMEEGLDDDFFLCIIYGEGNKVGQAKDTLDVHGEGACMGRKELFPAELRTPRLRIKAIQELKLIIPMIMKYIFQIINQYDEIILTPGSEFDLEQLQWRRLSCFIWWMQWALAIAMWLINNLGLHLF
ncbi:cysteine protease ATG4B-like [Iris pallida]|uniref:Cysteine protease ATG4B-like n=1 Tax=Iris pallida TaxID=29817 RepID=A0AAX6EYT9_IRIPA|nr:cysteine protease ATG4B-like [Iris pallida]